MMRVCKCAQNCKLDTTAPVRRDCGHLISLWPGDKNETCRAELNLTHILKQSTSDVESHSFWKLDIVRKGTIHSCCTSHAVESITLKPLLKTCIMFRVSYRTQLLHPVHKPTSEKYMYTIMWH